MRSLPYAQHLMRSAAAADTTPADRPVLRAGQIYLDHDDRLLQRHLIVRELDPATGKARVQGGDPATNQWTGTRRRISTTRLTNPRLYTLTADPK